MRRLSLERFANKPEYTIGRLFVDGIFLCHVLEDADRGLRADMPATEIIRRKIPGRTAIPTGTYHIDCCNVSPKFRAKAWAVPYGGRVPLLVSVNGYCGVRIHPGIDASSTSACLIPGRNTIEGKVTDSQECYHKLMSLIDQDPDVTITIYNTYE